MGASANLGMGGGSAVKKPSQPFKPFDVKKKLGTGSKPLIGGSSGMGAPMQNPMNNVYQDVDGSSNNVDISQTDSRAGGIGNAGYIGA